MKKILATLAAASGLALAAPASAIVVGGIDFGPMGAGPSNIHIDTATLAQTHVTGNGQNVTVYGSITTINGANPTSTPNKYGYCAYNIECELYYITELTNSQNYSQSLIGDYVEFAGSTTTVYYASGSELLNLMGQNSPTNLSLISAMTPWITFVGHGDLGGGADPTAVAFGSGNLTGATLSGGGNGLWDVDLNGPGNPDVIAFLDGNNVPDASGGWADVAYTSSFNNFILNQNDIDDGFAVGCRDGNAANGQWCWQGTTNLRGNTVVVPEPALLGLLAGGLLGLGVTTRIRRRPEIES